MIECGKRIPDTEHAVSVSLPTMRDVIGYEKKHPSVMGQICSGYPRFICHWMVQRVQDLLGENVIVLRDAAAVEQLQSRVDGDLEVIRDTPFGAVRLPDKRDPLLEQSVRCFLQHTGLQLSSREAEDFLVSQGHLPQAEIDAVPAVVDPARQVTDILSDAYGCDAGQVCLFPSGMAAYYAVFSSLDRIQRSAGKDTWVQVGWLYLDTSALLDRYAGATKVFAVDALDQLASYLAQHHTRIAAVTTEIMTNPLLQTTDILQLSCLCRRYDVPLIIDVSMPTPMNVDVLAHADVVIESLTKFAGGHADVMGGTAVFRRDSSWAAAIRPLLWQRVPYRRDVNVLAHHIQDYRSRMETINKHAAALVAFFARHPKVRRVFWAGQPGSLEFYDAIRRPEGGYGGVLSVVFNVPLERIYDRLSLLKGPSFGTNFTLCMPYVYLAHFSLVSSEAGRETLRRHGVDPELLRISVGQEPVADIIAAFDDVL